MCMGCNGSHVQHAASAVAHMRQHRHRDIAVDGPKKILWGVNQAQFVVAAQVLDEALQHVEICGEVGPLCCTQEHTASHHGSSQSGSGKKGFESTH